MITHVWLVWLFWLFILFAWPNCHLYLVILQFGHSISKQLLFFISQHIGYIFKLLNGYYTILSSFSVTLQSHSINPKTSTMSLLQSFNWSSSVGTDPNTSKKIEGEAEQFMGWILHIWLFNSSFSIIDYSS